ncbi:hypothetical protein [Rhodococcus sp. WB9]|uniref:hypothetical protein n=1 Tax=Rhodococcus sp. WB9 TaxID=2594007 RepID=UPI0021B47910|nr:hypothetical protein [Rhodococcus sp. WB9]
MLVGTTLTIGEAADRLGSAVRADGVTRTLAHLRNAPRWDDTLTALTRLADHLTAEPPPGLPWPAARRPLGKEKDLPPDRHTPRCRPEGGFRPVPTVRTTQRAPRVPIPVPPGRRRRPRETVRVPAHPHPALAALLDQEARRFLDGLGLGAEPVAWHPPLYLLDGLALPGPDPTAVDLAALHGLTRGEHTALSEIARQLGTTLDVIRHLLENQPAPESSTAAERLRRYAAQTAAEEALGRAQFVDLYCVQRRTLAEIAAMIGVSRKVPGRLARHHGITPAAGGPPVDPAWFHHQYVTQRRTLRELGHEAGRSVPRMSRIAKDYGIPTRPPSEACRTDQLPESR